MFIYVHQIIILGRDLFSVFSLNSSGVYVNVEVVQPGSSPHKTRTVAQRDCHNEAFDEEFHFKISLNYQDMTYTLYRYIAGWPLEHGARWRHWTGVPGRIGCHWGRSWTLESGTASSRHDTQNDGMLWRTNDIHVLTYVMGWWVDGLWGSMTNDILTYAMLMVCGALEAMIYWHTRCW